MKYGIKIPFEKDPHPIHLQNRVHGNADRKFVKSEINCLLKAGVIRKCYNWKPWCTLPITCIPKKNGKRRLVLDCRYLNKNIKTPKFSQERIEVVGEQIQEGDDAISVDLENRFHHVKIHKRSQQSIGMQWEGDYFIWRVLPFGISCAPFFFSMILRPVVSYLRENNMRITLFVDDFFQISRPEMTTDQNELLIQTLRELGWQINFEKSQLMPSKQCTFVGFNTTTIGNKGPYIKVLPTKIKKLKSLIRRVLKFKCVKAGMLTKIMGQCISMMRAIIPAKLLLRNLYRTIATKESWDMMVRLNNSCVNDLQWWLKALNNWNRVPLCTQPVQMQIETDASGSGWRNMFGGSRILDKENQPQTFKLPRIISGLHGSALFQRTYKKPESYKY